MTIKGIYTLFNESRLGIGIDFAQLPMFNESNIFWLEALGEGGCGTVQKAYNKQESQFIAIKRFPNMQESNQEKLAEILVEHDMLQSIEKIREPKRKCRIFPQVWWCVSGCHRQQRFDFADGEWTSLFGGHFKGRKNIQIARVDVRASQIN